MRLSTFWQPLPLLALVLFTLPAQAQQRASGKAERFVAAPDVTANAPRIAAARGVLAGPLNETFEGTFFPPPGWTSFDNGIGTVQSWTRFTDGQTPENLFAGSQYENVTGIAADYLVTPLLTIAPGSNTLTFKMAQGIDQDYGSTYAIAVSTTAQTGVANFTDLYNWNEATGPNPGDPAPPVLDATGSNFATYTVSLAAYDGQQIYVAFVHRNDDGDYFFLDNVTGPTADTPTTPAFVLSPAAPQNFGTAGPCAANTSVTRTFTVGNAGGGSLTVNSATLAGSSAFTVTSTLPTTLNGDEATTFTVTFQPTAAQTGVQSSTLTVNYNDGTAQTATVALTGTADQSTTNGGTGAGFAFANSATGVCAPTGQAPAGTGFIDIATHTRVTTWTDDGATGGDDSYFTLDAPTLDALISGGQVRFMGRNVETLFINSNGYVGFGTATGSTIGSLPTSTGGGIVAAFGQDLDLTTATYDADDPGQYPVGVYYGSSDVNGDGTMDLVVTWYHAYDFGSPAYTDATARYATFQLVIYRGARANEDDSFEVRLLDGNDAAGIPYRLNTAVGGSTTLENDVSIGVSAATSAADGSSEYHDNTTGGPVYASGGGSLAVRFTPQTQATTADVAGWRLMGAPVNTFTVGRLADLNLVQSVTGQYPTFPSDNVLTGYTNTTGVYTSPAGVTTNLDRGKGFFWYLFDQNITPDPASAGGGTSVSYELPMALQATGSSPSTTVNVTLATAGNGTDNVFTMAANPYRTGLDVSPATVATWATGGTNPLASNVVQYYDTASGTYMPGMMAPTPYIVSAWTGFFVENAPTGGRTTLAIPPAAQAAGGTFPGLTAEGSGLVAFELAGTTADGAATLDRAATLVFDATATPTWDVLDASKLTPPLAAYATLGFQGEGILGTETVKAQESRPLSGDAFDVPLVVDAVGTAPALTLTWPTLTDVPETVALELRDLATGTVIDLRTQASYTFDVAAGAPLTGSPEALLARTTTAAQAKAGTAPRFVLHVAPRGATATEADAPRAFALAAPAPNPTTGDARVAFDVPTASDVSVVLYDLLGRRVATLAEGQMTAGRHEARLNAGALAPGVYVVRMQAGTFQATRRMTVVR